MAGKRDKIDPGFQAKKRAKITYNDKDRISHLADDILVMILSLLSFKEAVCTSVLSSRWIHVWKQIPSLTFDAHVSLKRVARGFDISTIKRQKYVKWVNSVIQSHEAAALKEFRICLNLSNLARKAITRWLKFAFARRVQVLELDLSAKEVFFRRQFSHCAFPEELLTQSWGEASSSSKPSSDGSGVDFNFLKVLSLKYVVVTCEVFKLFIRNFPMLERLVVEGTHDLVNVEACGPSLALKHLELSCCENLKTVKVSAPNLTTLILAKVGVENLSIENVPKLVEVSADSRGDGVLAEKILSASSSWISQLEIFSLKLSAKTTEFVPSAALELTKLKKLAVFIYHGKGYESLMGVARLIKSCPNLQECVFKLMWWSPYCVHRVLKSSVKFSHEHLKVFKFYRYFGRPDEVELLESVLENCIVLEKLVIDPDYRSPYFVAPQNPDDENEKQAVVDAFKFGIQSQLPQHIELVIL
ncbi:hypothetical protein ABFS83_10G021200 [Erythranthe nasuta]